MQNFIKYLEDQKPRLRPSEHKELVKIKWRQNTRNPNNKNRIDRDQNYLLHQIEKLSDAADS